MSSHLAKAGRIRTSGEPALHAVVVAPNDAADLAEETRAIYVGVAGDVVATLAGDDPAVAPLHVLFKALPVGIHQLSVRRIWNTGTTATNLLALW